MIAGLALCAVCVVLAPARAAELLNPKAGLVDNLRAIMESNKPVTVVLKGGEKTYTARIGGVGDAHVLLVELSGKEFYNALVEIDEIAAIEVRARDQ